MNRIFTLLLALFAIATAAQAQFGGGDGSKYSPYLIKTTDHLTELANNVNGGNNYRYKYFRLENNLDFTGKTYTIIGDQNVNVNAYFAGKFDGNGKTIEGVNLDRTSTVNNSVNIGLFGRICYEATVENLTLSNSTIKGRVQVGGIVGSFYDFYSSDPNVRSVVRNCHVTSDVTIETVDVYDYGWQPSGNVGSIVGRLDGDRGSVSDCTSAATIKASSRSVEVGGIVGATPKDGNIISGCAYTGSISSEGTSYVGGIVGGNYRNSTITDNFVGGNCTIGAVGVAGSTQGSDEGYSVTHIYTIRFNSAQMVNGTIDTPPTKTIGGTDYYAAGSTITLSNVSTFGTPGGGNMWSYRAYVNNSNQPEVFPQEDGTWQFTMPNGNVLIVPEGAIDITLTGYPYNTKVTFTPANATYTGSTLHPTAVVEARGTTLTEGTQFFTDIPAAGFTNAGKYPVKVWGKGDYAGLRIDTFTIAPASILELTLSETSVYYDGQAHKPTLTVRRSLGRGRSLIIGTEYETDLPAEGFTELGDYIIKVWGVGNYTDTLSATYTICHPWDGMGTQYEPFLIKNTDDMDRLAALVNGGRDYAGVYFRQTANLDYAGKTYTPVGTMATSSIGDEFPFNGHFGSYLDYKFLNVNIDQDLAGLFGYVGPQGKIETVTLSGAGTISGKMSGGIVAINEGRVESCSVDTATVSIVGGAAVGGIVGVNRGVVMPNKCKASVSNDARYTVPEVPLSVIGGIVGLNTGDDDPETDKGGVYGEFSGNVTVFSIDTCLCVAGGVVGFNNSVGKVRATMRGTITTPNTGAVIGGVVGGNEDGGIVEDCLSDFLMTDVEGANCGAIVGLKADDISTVRNCYYIGACRYGGINDTDVPGQAMRGWPVSCAEAIFFMPLPDANGNNIGTYYDDGVNNHFHAGDGELLRLELIGGTDYSANGTPLTVAGYDDDYGVDYYELTMPAQPVHIVSGGLMITLYDRMVNFDNLGRISESDGKVRSVKIDGRTLFKDGSWNTICLPFDLDSLAGTPLEGATVMELDAGGQNGVDPATGTLHLTFKDTTAIKAGRPYLVKWDSGDDIATPVFTDVIIDASQPAEIKAQSPGFGAVTFKGSYAFTWLAAGDKTQLFLTPGNELKYATEDRYLLPFRGYFHVDESTAQHIRSYSLDFGDGPVTTLTPPTFLAPRQPQTYDLQGRRVTTPQKGGVYIVNGKKVLF